MKVPSINSVVTNWREEVVIRIVQSPPTHPQTLNNERSLNSTRYQSEKDILYSYTQLKLVSLSNNFKLKRWSVISCDSHNVLLSLHSALLGYCVWRGSHYSLWNDKKIEKEKERKRKKKTVYSGAETIENWLQPGNGVIRIVQSTEFYCDRPNSSDPPLDDK